MQELNPPKVNAIAVVAAQPTEGDTAMIATLNSQQNQALPPVAYIVKVELKAIPPATSQGWALYVGELRIPKYWEYGQGVYFKVFDPQFFADHKGERLRFSQNGVDFYDTGKKLPPLTTPKSRPATKTKATKTKADRLPSQDEVLK